MEERLILAKLNPEQIEKAKEVNGKSKRITHVLIAGSYGNRFGTEKQCLKYYNAWKDIFKELFSESRKVEEIENVIDWETTFDLVNILFDKKDSLPNSRKNQLKKLMEEDQDVVQEKKSLFKRIFGK